MSKRNKRRAYSDYWQRLKEAPMNPKYKAKVLTLTVPESLVKRVQRMISKEKDMDWEFRNENCLNPWKISFHSEKLSDGQLPGHGISILRILMDRRTDL